MKGRTLALIIGAALLVGVLATAGLGTVLAQSPWDRGWGPFGGMMGGSGFGGMMSGNGNGMMGGYGTGGGMMGGQFGQGAQSQSEPISLDKAEQALQAYVNGTGNGDLVVDEVMEFQNNFYAIVKEKSTGIGAFELLVNKYSGAVFPEMGPNMMWNTKYGHMGGNGSGMMGGGMMGNGRTGGMMGGGMMGGNGNGMMGGYGTGDRYGNGNPNANVDPSKPMTVTPEQATAKAQEYLNKNLPGTTAEDPDQFYGYYTLHTLKDGKLSGMLSVNGYTGAVWYHTWHGDFIQMKESGR